MNSRLLSSLQVQREHQGTTRDFHQRCCPARAEREPRIGLTGRTSSPGHYRALSYGCCHLSAELACGWLDICGGDERPSTFTFRYQAKPDVTTMTRSLQERPNATAGQWLRNTAELSGELSVGDIVAVGEVPLAVGRVGWTLVRDGLNEVRADEHGTHPLPARSRLPDTADRAAHPCPDQRSDLMTIGKPNRVTIPKRAVLNGTRTSHASMPCARGRWQPDVTRNWAGKTQHGGLAWAHIGHDQALGKLRCRPSLPLLSIAPASQGPLRPSRPHHGRQRGSAGLISATAVLGCFPCWPTDGQCLLPSLSRLLLSSLPVAPRSRRREKNP